MFGFLKKKEISKNNDKGNIPISFVLLNNSNWSKEKIIKTIKDDWNIDVKDTSDKDDIIFSDINNAKIVLSFMNARIPNNEAEFYAKANFMWKQAEEVVHTHKCHILVSITGSVDIKEKEELLVKISSSCLKLENAIALYSDKAVYEPKFYIESSKVISKNLFPIINLIWFGLYNNKKIKGFYTYGLYRYGYKEIEIYSKSNVNLNELYGLIIDITGYVINNNVQLHNGETIGFTPDQKLKITESKGIALDGDTIKIDID